MKYFTDEHVPLLLARLLRRAGVDVLTIQESGLLGRHDDELLEFAAREGRCVITANARDFDKLTRDFAVRGLPHAGVVCVPRSIPMNFASTVAAELVHIHERFPEGAYPYFLDYTSKSRNS